MDKPVLGLSLKNKRNGSVNILIDPLTKESGFSSPKLEADIFLFTDSGDKKTVLGKHLLITGPGEYDVKGVYIQGISVLTKAGKEEISKENTIYTIETEGMKICHLGKLAKEELTPDQLEKIGEVDVLMIPIGGGEAMNGQEAIKMMAQIEPKVTIPMYYYSPKLKIRKTQLKLDGLDEFFKALGIKSSQPLSKLSIKKKDISKDEAKIIVLEP